jgi:hypothetical protein
MATESRQVPQTVVARLKAINEGKAKHTEMGAGSFLTTPTKNRLLAIQTAYQGKYTNISLKKQAMVTLTNQKSIYHTTLQRVCSHFIQVFNLAIERGIFPVQDRTFYQIDVISNEIPNMDAEQNLVLWANNIMTGETNRIAAGGAAMAMPDLAEVQAAYANFDGVRMPHSTAIDAHDQAQEELAALNPEADAVVKKVWDEVETFYNEEDASSQRQNAREWGVVYVLKGSTKKISGHVYEDDGTGPVPDGSRAIANVRIFFENGLKEVVSDANGYYELTTTLMNIQKLQAENVLYLDYAEDVTLVENENLTWDIKMKKIL